MIISKTTADFAQDGCKFSDIRRRRDTNENSMPIRFWKGVIFGENIKFEEIFGREKNSENEYIEDLDTDDDLSIHSKLHNLNSEYYICCLESDYFDSDDNISFKNWTEVVSHIESSEYLNCKANKVKVSQPFDWTPVIISSGAVIGAVIVLIPVLICILCYLKKKNRKSYDEYYQQTPHSTMIVNDQKPFSPGRRVR